MDSATLRIKARASGPGLIFTVDFDSHRLYHGEIAQTLDLKHDFYDLDCDHALSLQMQGKTPQHTELDDQGHIIRDVVIELLEITVDDVDVTDTMLRVSRYDHDTNGTTAQIQDRFYGIMGCNGIVSLRFTSPFYLWMLDNA